MFDMTLIFIKLTGFFNFEQKSKINMASILYLFLLTCCNLPGHVKNIPNQLIGKDIIVFAEGSTLYKTNNNINDSLINQKTLLIGKIHDTGALNLFYVYEFNADEILAKRFFLDSRVYKNKYSSTWAKLEGYYTKTGKYKIGLAVEKMHKIQGIDKITGEAISRSKKWMRKNRTNIDLNQYKNTKRFQKAFLEFKNKNLNHLPFEPGSSITFIDFDRKYMGVNCGKYILRETAQRKDNLCIHAIYDYEDNTLQKIFVQNTGSFLE